jgi:hypothetical protein
MLPLLLAAAAILLAGCGLADPYARQSHAHPVGVAQSAKPPAPQPALEPTTSAATVLARFAQVWVNWSATTLPAERSALLALATGPLAQQLRADAAQAAKTQLQEVSNAYSRGRYIGLIADQADRTLVLTYEEVAPLGGQPQGAYHVYLARTEHTALGWRVTEWQPATDS